MKKIFNKKLFNENLFHIFALYKSIKYNIMFTQLTKENLPTPNRLVVIKRIPNKIDPNPIYVGYRMNKPYEVSEDHSKYSNWYGSKVKELSKCAFGEKKFDSMFSDSTVLEFCYLEDFINNFIN